MKIFVLQTGTGLHTTFNNFQFLMARNRDLIAIKKFGGSQGKTEVHILSEISKYQKFSGQYVTELEESHDNFQFLLTPERDLVAVKKFGGNQGKVEVHILSAASEYKQFSGEYITKLDECHDMFEFLLTQERDLVAIKKFGGSQGTTEIHILSAASGYKEYSCQYPTKLEETHGNFKFLLTANRDLVAIKTTGTGTNSTEVHILSAASQYQGFSLQTGTALGPTSENFEFLLDPQNTQTIFAVKKNGTATNTTELHAFSSTAYNFFQPKPPMLGNPPVTPPTPEHPFLPGEEGIHVSIGIPLPMCQIL